MDEEREKIQDLLIRVIPKDLIDAYEALDYMNYHIDELEQQIKELSQEKEEMRRVIHDLCEHCADLDGLLREENPT